jgi:hypothetical protein
VHCLVVASDGVASSVSMSNGSLALLAGTLHLHLPSWTNSQRTIYSLCSLGTDCIENTSPSSSSIVASLSYCTDCRENTTFQLLHCCMLQICCLATAGLQIRLSLLSSQFLPWANMPQCSLLKAACSLRHTAIYPFLRGCACDMNICPAEWHLTSCSCWHFSWF